MRASCASLVLLGLVAATSAQAAEQATAKPESNAIVWLREHFVGEWQVGTGGWRTAIVSTGDAPGFETLAGGGEMSLGFEVRPGLALVGNGRFLVGRHAGQLYMDGKGGLAVQLQANQRVRVRIGLTGGQLRDGPIRGVSYGGFVAIGVDLVQFRDGRSAMIFAARLDIDGHTGSPPSIPEATLALAVGLGLRY